MSQLNKWDQVRSPFIFHYHYYTIPNKLTLIIWEQWLVDTCMVQEKTRVKTGRVLIEGKLRTKRPRAVGLKFSSFELRAFSKRREGGNLPLRPAPSISTSWASLLCVSDLSWLHLQATVPQKRKKRKYSEYWATFLKGRSRVKSQQNPEQQEERRKVVEKAKEGKKKKPLRKWCTWRSKCSCTI